MGEFSFADLMDPVIKINKYYQILQSTLAGALAIAIAGCGGGASPAGSSVDGQNGSSAQVATANTDQSFTLVQGSLNEIINPALLGAANNGAGSSNAQYSVYSGQLESGESLGQTDCAYINAPFKNFGEITDDDWRGWLDDYWYSHGNEHLATGQDAANTYIRQQLVPNDIGSDRVQAGRDLEPAQTYRLTQALYFEPGFDWGGRLEGGKVGYGLGGGTVPSGGAVKTDGFTLRLMWRGNNDGTARIVAYSYAADRSLNLPWGDDHEFANFLIPVGEWFEVTLEVKTNSSIDANDGALRGWIDGELALQLDNIRWQTSGSQPAIQKLSFATFYGGSSIDWAPSHTTYIRYSNACWAPVVNASGNLLNDQPDSVNNNLPSLLRDDAILAVRGRVQDSVYNLELLLPTQIREINSKFIAVLDSLNQSLSDTQWINDDTVPLDSTVIADLAAASTILSSIAVDTRDTGYVMAEAGRHAQKLIDESYFLTTNSYQLVKNLSSASGCETSHNSTSCSTVNYKLANAQNSLDASLQENLQSSEQIRLIQFAWSEIVSAHSLIVNYLAGASI